MGAGRRQLRRQICVWLGYVQRLPPAADGSEYGNSQADILQRGRDRRALSSKGFVFIKFLTSGLGQLCGRGGRSVRARGHGGHQEDRAFETPGTDKHMASQRQTACTGPARVCTSWGHRAERRRGHGNLSLTRIYLQLITTCYKNFSPRESRQGNTALGRWRTQQRVGRFS